MKQDEWVPAYDGELPKAKQALLIALLEHITGALKMTAKEVAKKGGVTVDFLKVPEYVRMNTRAPEAALFLGAHTVLTPVFGTLPIWARGAYVELYGRPADLPYAFDPRHGYVPLGAITTHTVTDPEKVERTRALQCGVYVLIRYRAQTKYLGAAAPEVLDVSRERLEIFWIGGDMPFRFKLTYQVGGQGLSNTELPVIQGLVLPTYDHLYLYGYDQYSENAVLVIQRDKFATPGIRRGLALRHKSTGGLCAGRFIYFPLRDENDEGVKIGLFSGSDIANFHDIEPLIRNAIPFDGRSTLSAFGE